MIVPRRHRDLKKQLRYTFDPMPFFMMKDEEIKQLQIRIAAFAVRQALASTTVPELRRLAGVA